MGLGGGLGDGGVGSLGGGGVGSRGEGGVGGEGGRGGGVSLRVGGFWGAGGDCAGRMIFL